jgi:para-nitrobenzyl esterase
MVVARTTNRTVTDGDMTPCRVCSGEQQTLVASMRDAWASFADSDNPSTRASTAQVQWSSVADGAHVISLVPPQPQVETNFASKHHCSFWLAG